jgi:hypothetical protein
LSFMLQRMASANDSLSDDDVMAQVLQELYLFPKATSKGDLVFDEMTSASASADRLDKLVEFAGFSSRSFTMHGLVSLLVLCYFLQFCHVTQYTHHTAYLLCFRVATLCAGTHLRLASRI